MVGQLVDLDELHVAEAGDEQDEQRPRMATATQPPAPPGGRGMSAEPPAHEGAVHDDHERQEGESDADRDAERGDRSRQARPYPPPPQPWRLHRQGRRGGGDRERGKRPKERARRAAPEGRTDDPASIMVSAARPSGIATGGISSTTQPAARPTSAPCSGPRITAVATTPMSTRSGTKCDGTPRRQHGRDDERGHDRVCGAQEPEHREPHPASTWSVDTVRHCSSWHDWVAARRGAPAPAPRRHRCPRDPRPARLAR